MMTVYEVSSNDDFYSLKESWNALLMQSSANNVFLTWEWLYSWWQVYGRDKGLKIIVVRENNELRAIAPFYRTAFLGRRSLQFIGSYGVGSDYLDFILHPGREEELLNEILTYLDSQRNNWDILYISDMPEGSNSTVIISKHGTFYAIQKRHTICPYLKLPASWDELLSGFSPNMRYDLNRKHRRFEKEPHGRFLSITDKSRLEEAWKNFMSLNSKRMTEKDIAGPFTDRYFKEFHSIVIPLLFDKGILRLYALELGSPIGYIYIMKYHEKYYFYQIGFDPSRNKLSPGMLLFRYSIERAISEGVKEFDFLQGEEEYKFRWTKDVRYNVRYFIFRRSINNIFMILLIHLMLAAQGWKKVLMHNVKMMNSEIKKRTNNLKLSRSTG